MNVPATSNQINPAMNRLMHAARSTAVRDPGTQDTTPSLSNANANVRAQRAESANVTAPTRPEIMQSPTPSMIDARGKDAAMNTQDASIAKAAAGQGPTDDPVAQLMAAWGKNDPDWDLNGDGKVDGSDLAALLGKIASNTEPESPTVVPTPDQSSAAPNTEAEKPLPTVDGLMKVWGTNDPDHDLNGDGVVDGNDLSILLGQMTPSGPGGSLPPDRANMVKLTTADDPATRQARPLPEGPGGADAPAPAYASRLASLADAVMNRLAHSDAHDFSISDVRSLVDNLNLSGGDKRALLNRIATQFGNGRAVNAVG